MKCQADPSVNAHRQLTAAAASSLKEARQKRPRWCCDLARAKKATDGKKAKLMKVVSQHDRDLREPEASSCHTFLLAKRAPWPSYRGGPHMRSLISIDFPASEMEPESAHVVSAVYVP